MNPPRCIHVRNQVELHRGQSLDRFLESNDSSNGLPLPSLGVRRSSDSSSESPQKHAKGSGSTRSLTSVLEDSSALSGSQEQDLEPAEPLLRSLGSLKTHRRSQHVFIGSEGHFRGGSAQAILHMKGIEWSCWIRFGWWKFFAERHQQRSQVFSFGRSIASAVWDSIAKGQDWIL